MKKTYNKSRMYLAEVTALITANMFNEFHRGGEPCVDPTQEGVCGAYELIAEMATDVVDDTFHTEDWAEFLADKPFMGWDCYILDLAQNKFRAKYGRLTTDPKVPNFDIQAFFNQELNKKLSEQAREKQKKETYEIRYAEAFNIVKEVFSSIQGFLPHVVRRKTDPEHPHGMDIIVGGSWSGDTYYAGTGLVFSVFSHRHGNEYLYTLSHLTLSGNSKCYNPTDVNTLLKDVVKECVQRFDLQPK